MLIYIGTALLTVGGALLLAGLVNLPELRAAERKGIPPRSIAAMAPSVIRVALVPTVLGAVLTLIALVGKLV
jgi:hypothetical protein